MSERYKAFIRELKARMPETDTTIPAIKANGKIIYPDGGLGYTY